MYISSGSTVTLKNVAVSGNAAPRGGTGGGGIWNSGTLTLSSSTISGNSAPKDTYGGGAGGGIYNLGTLTVNNSTISGNSASVAAGIENGGKLALNNSTQNNGGPTLTQALLAGSPAIDAGDNNRVPPWDQRGPGFPRIVNGTIDIGAFEVQ